MRPSVVLYAGLAGVGVGWTVIPAWVIMRGPFFGGPLLEPMQLMYAVIAFFIGIFLLAGAGAKLFAATTSKSDGRAILKQDSANTMDRW